MGISLEVYIKKVLPGYQEYRKGFVVIMLRCGIGLRVFLDKSY